MSGIAGAAIPIADASAYGCGDRLGLVERYGIVENEVGLAVRLRDTACNQCRGWEHGQIGNAEYIVFVTVNVAAETKYRQNIGAASSLVRRQPGLENGILDIHVATAFQGPCVRVRRHFLMLSDWKVDNFWE